MPPHGACTLFNTRALKLVGGYSGNVRSQDGWEVWFKIRDRYKIASIPTSIFFYRQHQSSVTRSKNIIKERDKIIEKITKLSSGDYNQSSICILPIKNNYKYEKNVAFKKFNNDYLININIKYIFNNKSINRLVISSSDNAIKKYLQVKYKKNF